MADRERADGYRMTTRTPARRVSPGSRARRMPGVEIVVELAPVVLIALAEAAWISVAAGLLQEFSLHDSGLGVPGLAVAAAAGGLVVDPYRTRFLDDSLVAAIVFVAAAILALALTRLDAIGTDGGFDWRRNPRWLVLTIAMVIAAIAVAIPLA